MDYNTNNEEINDLKNAFPDFTDEDDESLLENLIEREAIQKESNVKSEEFKEDFFMTIHEYKTETNYTFQGLITEGEQVMIAGSPKAGKTLLAMQIAIAAASGGVFLGYRAARKHRVLYFNLEISHHQFAKRIVTMCGGELGFYKKLYGQFRGIHNMRSFNILDAADSRKIQQIIIDSKADFVVFDVLARCHTEDENNNSIMKQVLLELRTISGKATSVVVHHARKPPAGLEAANLGSGSIRGASSILGEVDTAINLVVRPGQGAKYSLTFTCRNVQEPDEMLLNRDDTYNYYNAEQDEEHRLKTLLQSCFGGSNSIDSSQLKRLISEAYNVKERQCYQYIKMAVDLDWIKTNKRFDGKLEYQITENSPILHIV